MFIEQALRTLTSAEALMLLMYYKTMTTGWLHLLNFTSISLPTNIPIKPSWRSSDAIKTSEFRLLT